MSVATLAILVLIAVAAIAGLIIYILLPPRLPAPSEEALNESIVAQQWAGGLDHAPSMSIDLPTHGGFDGG
jgi:hypothetical protein